jgi:hypothetical protein
MLKPRKAAARSRRGVGNFDASGAADRLLLDDSDVVDRSSAADVETEVARKRSLDENLSCLST